MRENKNMLKRSYKSQMVEVKSLRSNKFYAIINVKVKVGSETKDKTLVREFEGSRLQAKNELERFAKSVRGKVIHFGAFKN